MVVGARAEDIPMYRDVFRHDCEANGGFCVVCLRSLKEHSETELEACYQKSISHFEDDEEEWEREGEDE